MKNPASRSARQVFEDHLDLAQQGRFEEDIARNFSEGCVVLTNRGAFRGHEGLRQLAVMLQREIPDAEYGYINKLVEDGRLRRGRSARRRGFFRHRKWQGGRANHPLHA